MGRSVVVFTRDLRVHDHPALTAAIRHGEVVPLFVLDDRILTSDFNRPNRTGFLRESLLDLDAALRERGGRLVVRRGDWVAEVAAAVAEVGAEAVHCSDDVSPFARRRLEALRSAAGVPVHVHPGVNVVEPLALAPDGKDHFMVFTPYWNRWQAVPRRALLPAPRSVSVPDAATGSGIPGLDDLVSGARSPQVAPGGETAGRAALTAWARFGLAEYGDRHDDLPGDATSRIAPYLRFGCLSPLDVIHTVAGRPGAEPFVRQLCWRDFYAQCLAARPGAAWADYRTRGDDWNDDPAAFTAWTEGRTGYPVVDAAMRQLRLEGFVHNRARMITASFLTKDLYLDWRLGARWFLDWLVDGEIANNNLNWQWTAGTGTDTNPHRIFNPTVQGQRFDPAGDYVRRYVPELASVAGGAVHEPWNLPPLERALLDYPEPIVDHKAAIAVYKDRQAALTARRRDSA